MLVLRVEIVTVEPEVLVLAGEAECDAAGADVAGELVGGDELPHAVSTAAAPASTGTAHQRLRMSSLQSWLPESFLSRDYVPQRDTVHDIRWQSQASDIGYR